MVAPPSWLAWGWRWDNGRPFSFFGEGLATAGWLRFILQVATALWSSLCRSFIHDKLRENDVHFYFSDHQKGVPPIPRCQLIVRSTFEPFSYQMAMKWVVAIYYSSVVNASLWGILKVSFTFTF